MGLIVDTYFPWDGSDSEKHYQVEFVGGDDALHVLSTPELDMGRRLVFLAKNRRAALVLCARLRQMGMSMQRYLEDEANDNHDKEN